MTSHRLAVAVTTLSGALAACGSDLVVDRWPTFTVAGRVTTATGAPVVSTDVQATIWQSPKTCADPVASTLGSATTDARGAYETRLLFLTSTFNGCLRVQAGTATRDTLVSAVQPNARIAVDVQTP